MSAQQIEIYRNKGELHWVGDGFPVRSVFGYNDLGRKISPFLLMDYAAPYRFEPATEKRGVGGHPHRGFETVTIAYQGEIEHRDSSGGGGIIGPGDVQWMTAAAGLIHEEFHSSRFTKEGGVFEVIQLWVNLPAKDKHTNPNYQTLLDATIPRTTLPDSAGDVKVIAGVFNEVKGPAKTFTDINLCEVQLNSDKSTDLVLPTGHTKAIFVLRGTITLFNNSAGAGDLAILNPQIAKVPISAAQASRLLVLSGAPINEPIVGYGPFVMNTDAEIQQAFADYKAGRFHQHAKP